MISFELVSQCLESQNRQCLKLKSIQQKICEPGLRRSRDRDHRKRTFLTFARLTGDHNPLHVDADYARTSNYQGRIVHGAFQVGLASAVLGYAPAWQEGIAGNNKRALSPPALFPG